MPTEQTQGGKFNVTELLAKKGGSVANTGSPSSLPATTDDKQDETKQADNKTKLAFKPDPKAAGHGIFVPQEYYLHSVRPGLACFIGNTRVQFEGNYLKTTSEVVREELLTKYGKYVSEVTEEVYRA